MGGAAYLRLIGLGAAIGVPAALVAAGFIALVHELEHWLWDSLPDQLGYASPPWYLVLGLPLLGACVVLAARRLLPGDGGHSPLDGISVEPTPFRYGPGVALAAIGTLAFGPVLGPEAPLIALGSVVGLAILPLVRLGRQEQAVLATAGSFAAIAALFGGPLVAGLLLLEAGGGLGAALIPMLLPGLVAAAVGYLIFVGLGDWGGLDQTALVVPDLPAYQGTRLLDLLIALIVGIAVALIVALVRRAGTAVAERGGRRLGMSRLLLAGGLVIGLLALLADLLGADPHDVLFSGQSAIPTLVKEDSAGIVTILLVAKALAFAVCLGCGFRGGPVFPAIFLGVALAMLAVIAFDVSPTLAVAVGTAAGTAAMARLLFAALLFAALLVGSASLDVIPAAVLAAAAAWVTMAALDRRADDPARKGHPVASVEAAGAHPV